MRSGRRWWAGAWEGLTAAAIGLFLIGLYVAKNDPAALAAGVFLVTLGLFFDRLDELAIGPLKAKLFREIKEALARELPLSIGVGQPADRAAAPAEAAQASREPELFLTGRVVEPQLAQQQGFGRAVAFISRDAIDAADSPNELARALATYIDPGRRLSKEREISERAAFAEIMNLQTRRSKADDLGQDTPEERDAARLIDAIWNRPADLSDAEVRGLIDLLDGLRREDERRGIPKPPNP
jgi:hypothetical protein